MRRLETAFESSVQALILIAGHMLPAKHGEDLWGGAGDRIDPKGLDVLVKLG